MPWVCWSGCQACAGAEQESTRGWQENRAAQVGGGCIHRLRNGVVSDLNKNSIFFYKFCWKENWGVVVFEPQLVCYCLKKTCLHFSFCYVLFLRCFLATAYYYVMSFFLCYMRLRIKVVRLNWLQKNN